MPSEMPTDAVVYDKRVRKGYEKQLARATRKLGVKLGPWLEKNKGNVIVVPILKGGMMTYHILREHLGDLMPRTFRGLNYGVNDSMKYIELPPRMRKSLKTKWIDGHITVRPTPALKRLFNSASEFVTGDVLTSYLGKYGKLLFGGEKKILLLEGYSAAGSTSNNLKNALTTVFPAREVKIAAFTTGNLRQPSDFFGEDKTGDPLYKTLRPLNPVVEGDKCRYLLCEHNGEPIVIRYIKLSKRGETVDADGEVQPDFFDELRRILKENPLEEE